MSVEELPERRARRDASSRTPPAALRSPPFPIGATGLHVAPAFDSGLTLAALSRGVARLADGRWLASAVSAPASGLFRGVPAHLLAPLEPAAFDAALRRALAGAVADEISMGLERRHPRSSARAGMSARQRQLLQMLAGSAAGCALLSFDLTVLAIALVVATLFVLHLIVSLAVLIEHGSRVAAAVPPALPDDALPSYGVLVPLRGEEAVLHTLLKRLGRIDYPRDRLQVRLAIDADDPGMLRAVGAVRLPPAFSVVVVPPGRPRTKPRALNAALLGLTTDHVVVFDAEDEPDPLQLRKAAALFAQLPPEVACLQARLCIANTDDAFVTRLFTLEYAGLFDVAKPALASLGWPVPLGGTSNHFRRAALDAVGAWDAWNVTEDADLGLRLARHGYSVRDLDSTTLEEAPKTWTAWLKQRRRWMKGWLQTLVVHTRTPRDLLDALGPVRLLATMVIFGGTLGGAMLFPFLSGAFLLRWAMHGLSLGSPARNLTEALAVLVFLLGVGACVAPAAVGARSRGMTRLLPLAPVMLLYTVPICLATWLALRDYLRDPFHWSKTEHGLGRTWTRWPDSRERSRS